MSKGIARVGLDSAGGPILTGASTVFANGAKVARIGDAITPHGSGPHTSPVLVEGSSTVFAEGKAVSRKGDAASCGHTVTPGSSNVFAG